MRDTDDEIREIKKEIVESRGLLIKTNNLVSTLGAELKAISKRQAGYEKRFTWNSGVAYATIAAVTFMGLKLASDARVSQIRSEMDGLRAQVAEQQTQLQSQTRRVAERVQTQAQASELLALVQQNKREQFVQDYPAVDKKRLSPIEVAYFDSNYDRFASHLSRQAHRRGLSRAASGKHNEAIQEYKRALELSPNGVHRPTVLRDMVLSYRKAGQRKDAMQVAQRLATQTIDKSKQAEGLWWEAQCAADLRDIDSARATLKTLINKWPRSKWSREARPLLRELTREAILGKDR